MTAVAGFEGSGDAPRTYSGAWEAAVKSAAGDGANGVAGGSEGEGCASAERELLACYLCARHML